MYEIRPEWVEKAGEYYEAHSQQWGCEEGEYLSSAAIPGQLVYCVPGRVEDAWWHVAVETPGRPGWAHGIVLELSPGVFMHRSGTVERVPPDRVMIIGSVTRIVDVGG